VLVPVLCWPGSPATSVCFDALFQIDSIMVKSRLKDAVRALASTEVKKKEKKDTTVRHASPAASQELKQLRARYKDVLNHLKDTERRVRAMRLQVFQALARCMHMQGSSAS